MDTGPAAGTEPWERAYRELAAGKTLGWWQQQANCDLFKAGWDACAAFYDGKPTFAEVAAMAMPKWKKMPITDAIEKLGLYDAITAEDIYNAYPRKVGKQAALKAIEKAFRVGPYSRRGLLDRVKEYAAAVAKWPAEERQYCPHPASWFNAGRYDDDSREWQRGTQAVQIRAAN